MGRFAAYKHLVPDPEQWDAILTDRPLPREPRSTLITDFYSYNTNLSADGSSIVEDPQETKTAWMQPHWVGDLTLSASVDVSSPKGELCLELVKGGLLASVHHQRPDRRRPLDAQRANVARARLAHQGARPLPSGFCERG